jgi:hypothetical protein
MSRLVPVLLLVLSSASATGEDGEDSDSNSDYWFDSVYMSGGYGIHWTDSEDYNGTQWLVGLDASRNDRHRIGIALFNNSFGQFSQYYYYGYKWRLPFISESAHLTLTGGMLYGYVDEYEDKLNPNWDGWAPAIIPSIGWKKDRLGFDFAILGDAGAMFLVGYDIWRR